MTKFNITKDLVITSVAVSRGDGEDNYTVNIAGEDFALTFQTTNSDVASVFIGRVTPKTSINFSGFTDEMIPTSNTVAEVVSVIGDDGVDVRKRDWDESAPTPEDMYPTGGETSFDEVAVTAVTKQTLRDFPTTGSLMPNFNVPPMTSSISAKEIE